MFSIAFCVSLLFSYFPLWDLLRSAPARGALLSIYAAFREEVFQPTTLLRETDLRHLQHQDFHINLGKS